MAESVQQPIEVPVPLQLFGGLVTEMNASDLPEGITPACSDIDFFPGGISSRGAANKWVAGLPHGTTVTYQKSFVTPWGATKNLFLASDGSLWVNDITNNPTTWAKLIQVTPGSYASSVTVFGKELLCFHNNVNGIDVPRSFDGTYMDRATQCGPGAPPVVSSVPFSSNTLATAGGITGSVSGADTVNQTFNGHFNYWAAVEIELTAPANLIVGGSITITGNSNAFFNRSWAISQIVSGSPGNVLTFLSTGLFGNFESGTGGSFTGGAGFTLSRSNNTVSGVTAAPHNLLVGYQVQISDVPDKVIATITNIVINNEVNSGVATVTTSAPHDLQPQNVVKLLNVANSPVGGAITGVGRYGDVVTVNTTSAHTLQVGAVVVIAGVTDPSFNGQFTVLSVPSTTSFTYALVDTDTTSTGGTVNLVWPVSNSTIIPNDYEVVEVPTPTTFTVELSYNDGTWAGGSVTFAWAGTFYVTSVQSSTQFAYQQYGPDATTNSTGTATPVGQAAPGLRSCVVLFQTRQGLITAPSPPTTFITNGGQYISVSNIPIGWSNVIARILAFTGANGQNYFYIPYPAQVNGIDISSSTVIQDNVTTSVTIDFADLTLFDSIAIDIPGNNLFEMGVLGPCLGVAKYASRAAWYGMYNSVQNFLNLGFEGGYYSAAPTMPLGWDYSLNVNGALGSGNGAGNWGFSWTITSQGAGIEGLLQQNAFEDYNNVPILLPNTLYTTNLWLKASPQGGSSKAGSFIVDAYSPSLGHELAYAAVPYSQIDSIGGFYRMGWNTPLPGVIPSDTVIRIYANGMNAGDTLIVDEVENFPTLIPTVNQFMFSYINLPEALDLETGRLGPTDDSTPLQCAFTYRDTFLFLTNFGLHETNDLAGYEPENWQVRETNSNCGACGPRAISTAENFSAWVTSPVTQPPVGRGLYLYTGGAVYKLSQEIQPDFDSVNPTAQASIWCCNDAIKRKFYVGLPTGTNTAPNIIYALDYREMNTASEIAEKPPIHISFTGKMICSDLSRKWGRYNLASNSGEIMDIPGVGMQFSIGAGNGLIPGQATGFGNCYWFNTSKYTDDDYGAFTPYYTTYFFVNHEMEMQIQVGVHRKLYKRFAIFINGIGNMNLTPYGDALYNPLNGPPPQPMSRFSTYDMGDGLNVIAERCAFKIFPTPFVGSTDVQFVLGKFIVTMQQEPVAPIRFGAV